MAARDLVVWAKNYPLITHRCLCSRDFEISDTGEDYHYLCWGKSCKFKSDCCPLRGFHVLPNSGGGSHGQDFSRLRDGERSFVSLSSGRSGHLPSKHPCCWQVDRPEENPGLRWI